MKNAERMSQRIAHYYKNYADMAPKERDRLEKDLMRHYFTPKYQCSPFDPAALVALAKEQYPDRPMLAEALARCTQQWRKDKLYGYFVDPTDTGRSRYDEGFGLLCPRLGDLQVDVAENGEIIGVEYLEEVMRTNGEGDPQPSPLWIVHWKE